MSKKPDRELFELIKSLSKGEKKNFALFSRNYTSKYLVLYKMIDAQKEYNESDIKRRLTEKKIKTPLAQMKMYLLESVLKSLRFGAGEKSIRRKITDLVCEAEILHNKGFKKLRDKILKKARQLAQHHEKYGMMIDIFLMEMSLLKKPPGQFYKSIDKCLEKIHMLVEYDRNLNDAQALYDEGIIRDRKLKSKWDSLMQSPLLNKSNIPEGKEEQYIYNRIWAIYTLRQNDFQKSLHYRELVIKNMESRQEEMKSRKGEYMREVNNIIDVLCQINKIDEAKKEFNKLSALNGTTLSKAETDQLNAYTTLAYTNITGFFLKNGSINKESEIAVSDAVLLLEKEKIKPIYAILLHTNISLYYFMAEKYDMALTYNNIVLNLQSQGEVRKDVYELSVLLNLIIHYEVGNDDLLPYYIRSAYRSLRKKKRLFNTEAAILRFIRNKLHKGNSSKELIIYFKELKTELERIIQDPYEKNFIDHFNFIAWLESKIENRSFIEIIREKAKIIKV